MIRGLAARLYGAAMRRLDAACGLHAYCVFRRPLRQAPGDGPPGIVLRRLNADQLLRYAADPQLELSRAIVSAAHARGDWCVGAFDGDRLVGYVWFALRDAPHIDGVWVRFAPDAVYTYKSFVLPAYRGCGIAVGLYRFADARFLAQGRRYALICVDTDNFPSIAAARKSGALSHGYLAYWRRGNGFVAFHTPRLRDAGFAFYLSENAGIATGAAALRVMSAPDNAGRETK